MKTSMVILATVWTVTVHGVARAETISAIGPSAAVVLIDSTGKTAARAVSDNVMLVTVHPDVVAPALIRAIHGSDGRAASGWAAWQAGGSVLFSSPDCTMGAHLYSQAHPGLRSTTQVQTPEGIVLYVGAFGIPTTVPVRSILYDTGCSTVTVLATTDMHGYVYPHDYFTRRPAARGLAAAATLIVN